MKEKLNILFPVEGINREIDFRLFLACMHAHEGNRVFVGQHNAIDNLTNFVRGGLYVGKNIFKGLFPSADPQHYIKLKKRDFILVYLDEEGMPFESYDQERWREWLMWRLNANYLTADDYICNWGEYQSDFYRSRQPACKDNIRTTGHPRFDVYKPAYREFFKGEVDKIRCEQGEFILINTRLQFANPGLGMEHTFSSFNNYDPANDKIRMRFVRYWAHLSHYLANLVQLVTRLSIEFPEETFIIRPYPGEDINYYKAIFRDIKNVRIILEGPVGSWLLACKLLIHDGCTTGVEGVLSDIPVIDYKSLENEEFDVVVPNNVGIKCWSEEEVIENVRKVINNEPVENIIQPLVHELFTNFQDDSFAKLIEVLNEAEQDVRSDDSLPIFDEGLFKVNKQKEGLVSGAKKVVRPLFKDKQHQYLYFSRIFPGFDRKIIADKLDRIQNITGKKITHKLYGNDLILIESA